MIRNGGNDRVQLGSSCPGLDETNARKPKIRSAIDRGSMIGLSTNLRTAPLEA